MSKEPGIQDSKKIGRRDKALMVLAIAGLVASFLFILVYGLDWL